MFNFNKIEKKRLKYYTYLVWNIILRYYLTNLGQLFVSFCNFSKQYLPLSEYKSSILPTLALSIDNLYHINSIGFIFCVILFSSFFFYQFLFSHLIPFFKTHSCPTFASYHFSFFLPPYDILFFMAEFMVVTFGGWSDYKLYFRFYYNNIGGKKEEHSSCS